MTWAIWPSAAGRIRHLPGLAVKSLASANCRAGAGSSSRIASHVALVAKTMGIAEAAGAVSNTECMLVSVFIQTGGATARYRGGISKVLNI